MSHLIPTGPNQKLFLHAVRKPDAETFFICRSLQVGWSDDGTFPWQVKISAFVQQNLLKTSKTIRTSYSSAADKVRE